MAGISCEDEDKCIFFKALSEEDKQYNIQARQATEGRRVIERDKENKTPGSLNTICGRCIQKRIVDEALFQKY